MTDAGANKSLDQAMLALLVAADQCCPAIIGQAHLLYHARSSAMPESIARAFEQLRRDAAGLLQAITDVEEAMQARAGAPSASPAGGARPHALVDPSARATGLARLPRDRPKFRPS